MEIKHLGIMFVICFVMVSIIVLGSVAKLKSESASVVSLSADEIKFASSPKQIVQRFIQETTSKALPLSTVKVLANAGVMKINTKVFVLFSNNDKYLAKMRIDKDNYIQMDMQDLAGKNVNQMLREADIVFLAGSTATSELLSISDNEQVWPVAKIYLKNGKIQMMIKNNLYTSFLKAYKSKLTDWLPQSTLDRL